MLAVAALRPLLLEPQQYIYTSLYIGQKKKRHPPKHMKHEQGDQKAAEEQPGLLAQLLGQPDVDDHVLGKHIQPRHAEHRGKHEKHPVRRKLHEAVGVAQQYREEEAVGEGFLSVPTG